LTLTCPPLVYDLHASFFSPFCSPSSLFATLALILTFHVFPLPLSHTPSSFQPLFGLHLVDVFSPLAFFISLSRIRLLLSSKHAAFSLDLGSGRKGKERVRNASSDLLPSTNCFGFPSASPPLGSRQLLK